MFRWPAACYRFAVVVYLALLLLAAVVLLLGVRGFAAAGPPFDVVGLVGSEGEAVESFSESGRVVVRGEIWKAVTRRGIIQRGERVRIVAVEPELTLVVEKLA